jgi:predicted ArsR family transcriptional regulator
LRERRGKDITAVTVRHHLNILQQEGLITEPELRHRTTPGRPQHLYMLTDKAAQIFPNNYQTLISGLVGQLEQHLPSGEVNVIFEGVADRMVENFTLPDVPWQQRMDLVVDYLNQHGYDAFWETCDQGAILHTRNCPYHQIAHSTDTLCSMDLRLIVSLVGIVPRRLSRVSQGDETCAYLLPMS